MDNTRETVRLLLRTLVAQGFEPPAIMHREAGNGQPSGRDQMAETWAHLLNFAGITAREALDALANYIVEPNASQYRKPWPDVGMLVARSAPGRRAAALGSDADCAKAWARFDQRMRDLLPEGPTGPADLHPVEAHAAALWAGLVAMGGTEAYRTRPEADAWPVKAWKDGYRAERRRQAADPAQIRRMLDQEERRMLPGAK